MAEYYRAEILLAHRCRLAVSAESFCVCRLQNKSRECIGGPGTSGDSRLFFRLSFGHKTCSDLLISWKRDACGGSSPRLFQALEA